MLQLQFLKYPYIYLNEAIYMLAFGSDNSILKYAYLGPSLSLKYTGCLMGEGQCCTCLVDNYLVLML